MLQLEICTIVCAVKFTLTHHVKIIKYLVNNNLKAENILDIIYIMIWLFEMK